MAKIKNCVLTPELVEQLVRDLAFLPDDQLMIYGREFMPGGFTKPKAIRERLAMMIRGGAALPAPFVGLLACYLPCRETVLALSLAAIREMFDCLAALLGRETLLLALLVDEREDVQKLAAEQLSAPVSAPPTDADVESARTLLWEFLADHLMLPLGISTPPPDDPALAAGADQFARQLADQLESDAKTIARLKQNLQEEKDRAQARLKEAADKAAQEKKQATLERDQVKAKLDRAEQEKSALKARLAELSAQMDSAIARGVREQTDALRRKWLDAPARVEGALADTKSGDLLVRAEEVLAKQAAQDRHSGNRLELERRLKTLLETQERLQVASQTALSPVPELKPLLHDVEGEIARLQKMLFGSRPASDVASRLLERISESEDWDELRSLSRLIEELADRDLIRAEDERAGYNALHRKFSLLEERGKPKGPELDSGWSLRDALFRNKPTLLLLDGHNVLFGLRDLFAADYENGRPGRKARQRLVAVVDQLVRSRPNVAAKICFDSPDAELVRVSPNVEVAFSGGSGADRADEMIVSRLQFKDLQSLEQKVFVVTDDRAVRREILKTGAKFVPNDLFAVLLTDFKCLA